MLNMDKFDEVKRVRGPYDDVLHYGNYVTPIGDEEARRVLETRGYRFIGKNLKKIKLHDGRETTQTIEVWTRRPKGGAQ